MLKTEIKENGKKIQYYISENSNIYKTGDILQDLNNSIDDLYRINKFIVHNRRGSKEKYLAVNLNSVIYATKKITLSVDLLETNFIKIKE